MDEKVVLIGAGSAMFTRGLVGDMVRSGWEGDLALVDVDAGALETARALAAKSIQAMGSPLKLNATTDRRQALRDATLVICTIAVGGRRAWEKDVFIPRKHGIYQPVGDSVMPGGTSRALRMVPAMVAIAKDVLELAPGALFFNYANPMSVICRAVRKATGAEMVGLCHGVFHVGAYLAELLGVDKTKLRYTACGMNHLTWFTDVRADGVDLMPKLKGLAREDNPFTWDLLKLFGAFPAVLDRHITEFFPHMNCREGGYYGKTLGVDAFSFEKTIKLGDDLFERMKQEALSTTPTPVEKTGGEHEQVVEIVESVRRESGAIYSVNLPNQGQIPNLPRDVVVEGPAAAVAGGLSPLALKPLPSGVAGTLATRFLWAETTAEAALEGNRDKFVQALLLDGSVQTVAGARELADELLAAHAEHLPQFKA